ncbi:MAG: alpha/beta hydrolase [bacterium]|nr:alpha/beta hydrolase [bacterium]
MHHREFGWKTADGLRIFAQEWHPPICPPPGEPEEDPGKLVCLVHGMGEHSGRYAHVAAHLTRAGYAMLHNEPEKEEVLAEVTNWLEGRE